MSYKQQINIPVVITIGLVSALLLIVLIVGTQAWFQNAEMEESANPEKENGQSEFVAAREAARQTLTTQEAWTDNTKMAATVPVGWAMDILVKNNGKLPTTQP